MENRINEIYLDNGSGVLGPMDICIALANDLRRELVRKYGLTSGERLFSEYLNLAGIPATEPDGTDTPHLRIGYYFRLTDEFDREETAYELQDELVDAISEALPDNHYLDWVEDWPDVLAIYSYSE